MRLTIGRFLTISSHFFINQINIFNKNEVLTVILRCWTIPCLNWHKNKYSIFSSFIYSFVKKPSLCNVICDFSLFKPIRFRFLQCLEMIVWISVAKQIARNCDKPAISQSQILVSSLYIVVHLGVQWRQIYFLLKFFYKWNENIEP